ncbi:hypothetical protein LSH36_269g04014 [Paralvinella palmiformis]|uniref:Major facilitator superfamily (MFS) profile domain-containing protein n=1 Tax=Paralvinella palmiformis TaxID=53620 RepID=A0AAD9JJL2_9ANNE|nr:hypothetical protein LSH36_269g04014 [Paralvinella palmiformis]
MKTKDGSSTDVENNLLESYKPSGSRNTTVYGSVDTGWAWVIMIAITFWNNLVSGTLKSFGVLYLEYLDLYQRGPVMTAWLGFSFSITITLIAPLSGYIGDHVSLKIQRILVMVLSVVMAAAMAATGWMPRLEGAILTYGSAGFAVSLVDTPILSLLCKYFKKRRFLASGVVFAGASLGTLILPPLITYLVDCYSIRGAMVIFGGIWLNTMIVGAVIRPLRETPTTGADDKFGDPRESKDEESIQPARIDPIMASEEENNSKMSRSSLGLDLRPATTNLLIGCSKKSLDKMSNPRMFQTYPHSTSLPFLPAILSHINGGSREPDLSKDTNEILFSPDSTKNKTKSCDGQNIKTSNREINAPSTRQSEESSFGKRSCQLLHSYWSFLKTPGLPLVIFTLCAGSFAYFNQFFIFPSLAREFGMTKIRGAMLVSAANITELLSRLLVGVLVDEGRVKTPRLVQVSFALSAVLAMAVSFCSSQILLFVYSGLFGLFGGVFFPFAIPLMVELVPVSQISSAAGVFVFVSGIGISLGPPVLGGVKVLTGTFVHSLRVCSIFYVFALGSYILHRRNLKKCRTTKDTILEIAEH